MSLEMVMSAGKSNYFAVAGPGPKSLVAGDKNFGYFGPVTTDELFTSSDIISQIPELGDLTYTVWGADLNWHKFAINGKISYISLAPINTSITWNALYGLGLVYGTNDNGLMPASPATLQWRPIVKTDKDGDWVLTPRTLRLSTDDVLQTTIPTALDALAILNVVQAGYYRGNGKWNSVRPAFYNYAWSLNSYANVTGALCFGINGGISYNAKSGALAYMMVLDLQDTKNFVFPVTQMRGSYDGIRTPAVTAKVDYSDVIQPIDMSSYTYYAGNLDSPAIGNVTATDTITSPTDYSWSLQPVTPKANLSITT